MTPPTLIQTYLLRVALWLVLASLSFTSLYLIATDKCYEPSLPHDSRH